MYCDRVYVSYVHIKILLLRFSASTSRVYVMYVFYVSRVYVMYVLCVGRMYDIYGQWPNPVYKGQGFDKYKQLVNFKRPCPLYTELGRICCV